MKVFALIVSLVYFSSISAQVTLLEENFDVQGLPVGWERIDNDGNTPDGQVSEYTEAWIYAEDPLNSANGTFSSTSFFDPIDRADRWLITPSITLGTSGNFISWKGLSGDPSFPDSYKVMISTTTTDITAFTDTLVVVSNESPTWTSHEEDLEEYANQNIHIAFVNTTFDGFKLFLDSVYVREQDPLAINTEGNIGVEVYPNPTQHQLNINTQQPFTSLSIYSVVGNCIQKEVLGSAEKLVTLELIDLPAGIYHIHIRLISGAVVQRKFVKR